MARRADSGALEQEGRLIVERLGGQWAASGGICRCPAHDDRKPSLSVRPGRARLLFHCFAGCGAEEILRALQDKRLIEPAGAKVSPDSHERREDPLRAAALRIWNEARPIRKTPAQAYLESRGLKSDSPQLRFHPRTPHGPKSMVRYRPALIAAVRDDSGLVGIHRTFVDAGDLGAGASPSRCGLGRFGRGAVRLGGEASRLGLAEGVETALSATALFGIPCWATLGAARFGLISVPSCVDRLVLFLDHDQGGKRAEQLACEAFAGAVRIEAHYPPRPGDDWNDVLRRGGQDLPGAKRNPSCTSPYRNGALVLP